MEVILLDKIDNLVNVGDVVRVKPGYARNYLFPKGLAVRSSKRNIAFVEEKRKNIELGKKTFLPGLAIISIGYIGQRINIGQKKTFINSFHPSRIIKIRFFIRIYFLKYFLP